MKAYEKPCVMLSEELAEGVYAASGDVGNCMTVSVTSTQEWNNWSHVFEVVITHSTEVVHLSERSTVTLTFSGNITGVSSEFDVTDFSGNTVTLVRESHGNGYLSGDKMTYKVWVWAADEAAAKAISCTGATISCTHKETVQGGFD